MLTKEELKKLKSLADFTESQYLDAADRAERDTSYEDRTNYISYLTAEGSSWHNISCELGRRLLEMNIADSTTDITDQTTKGPAVYIIKAFGEEQRVSIETEHYSCNGSIAINLISQEPDSRGEFYDTITINVPDAQLANDTCQFIDVVKCPWAENFITANHLGYPTGRTIVTDDGKYPEYSFDIKKLRR